MDRGTERLDFNTEPPPTKFKKEGAWEIKEQFLKPGEQSYLDQELTENRLPKRRPKDDYRLVPKMEDDRIPRYLVEKEPIGSGGMAEVYKGWDRKLGRIVAIKLVERPRRQMAPDFASTLEREAKTIAKIKHPGIVEVYDYVEVNNRSALIEEFIEAFTLKEVLEEEGNLELTETIEIITAIAEVVDYLAKQGIFHSDLKPANIFRLDDGRIKIADFGLSSLISYDIPWGTANYMPPERIVGEDSSLRGEVFSLGMITYQLLTGRPLIDPQQNSQEQIFNKTSAEDFSLDKYNEGRNLFGVESVLRKALAREPEDRYASTTELTKALGGVLVNADGK